MRLLDFDYGPGLNNYVPQSGKLSKTVQIEERGYYKGQESTTKPYCTDKQENLKKLVQKYAAFWWVFDSFAEWTVAAARCNGHS